MEYIAVIGLETHCELNTSSKAFSRGKNEYCEIPNSNVVPLDMAFPGTLPILNKEGIKKALKMAVSLNCTIPDELLFDRKNYYYADLPKGYQITQMQKPVGINGYLDIDVDGKQKKVLIHDIHYEEDTASMDHYDDFSLIDYNRAGVPLIEIVTEPCLHSAKEALSYLKTLRNTFKYLQVSDADTKLGQIRCDVNVSLMKKTDKELGTKVEMKNINSFAKVASAIDCEIKRQKALLDMGKKDEIIQETRRYDDEHKTTISMRRKVESIDYKYFVEPNIPRIKIEEKFLSDIKKSIPTLPTMRKRKYVLDYGLTDEESEALVKDKDLSDYFEECLNLNMDAKTVSNWLSGNIISYLNKEDLEIKDFYLKPILLKQILDKIEDKTISTKQAKEIFNKALENKQEPKYLISDDMKQVTDEAEIKNIVKKVLENNLSQVQEYHNGKDNLLKYFVGQVMKESKGKANPSIASSLLKEFLDQK